MTSLRVCLTPEINEAITNLTRLKGADCVTLFNFEGKLSFAAIETEYFKIADVAIPNTCENFCIEVPARVLQSLILSGDLFIEIDNKIVLSTFVGLRPIARVTLPHAMDLNEKLITNVILAGRTCTAPLVNFDGLRGLSSVCSITNTGVQVKKGIASIFTPSLQIYKKIDSTNDFIMTRDCASIISSLANKSIKLQVFDVENYSIGKMGNNYFGWKKTRHTITDMYDKFKSYTPIHTTEVQLESCRRILASIPYDKTKAYDCFIDFGKGVIEIAAGNIGNYEINFGGKCDLTNSRVSVPFKLFKSVITSKVLELDEVYFNLYPTFITISYDGMDILMAVR